MNKLNKLRKLASIKSGGMSDLIIKEKVIFNLKKYKTDGKSLLDYGSGKGELIFKLLKEFNFSELAGADLFNKPKRLDESITWYNQDLNNQLKINKKFDFIINSETIEHLENPRATLRNIYKMLKNNGILILTMPNNESVRSYAGLLFGGHFTAFLGKAYPAHITAILKLDLVRICKEIGFKNPNFTYTDHGRIPKLPSISWQQISFNILRGKHFSDNLIMVVKK